MRGLPRGRPGSWRRWVQPRIGEGTRVPTRAHLSVRRSLPQCSHRFSFGHANPQKPKQRQQVAAPGMKESEGGTKRQRKRSNEVVQCGTVGGVHGTRQRMGPSSWMRAIEPVRLVAHLDASCISQRHVSRHVPHNLKRRAASPELEHFGRPAARVEVEDDERAHRMLHRFAVRRPAAATHARTSCAELRILSTLVNRRISSP